MSKRNIIAIVVLLALVAVFFLVREEPVETLATPYTITAIESPTRIEIVPGQAPADEAGGAADEGLKENRAELIVLERSQEGWRMTEPYDTALDEEVASGLEEALDGEVIAADDLDLDEAKAKDYWLGDTSRARVSIIGSGGEKAEFYLGRPVVVEGTGAERSYVMPVAGDPDIYRARTNLGALLRRDVDALRSKQILKLDADQLSKLRVVPEGGQPFVLEKQTAAWKLAEPTPQGFSLDEGEVHGLVNVLVNLRADHFRDDLDASQVGLAPRPAYAITVTTADGTDRTLHLAKRQVGEADAVEHLVQLKGSPFIMSIGAFQGAKLMRPLSAYRDRTPLEMAPQTIAAVTLAGAQRVKLVREGKGEEATWKMTHPREEPVQKFKAQGLVNLLSRLRVESYPEVGPEVAGLDRPRGQVTVTTEEGMEVNLFLGDEVEGGNGARYAWLADEEVIFTLPAATVERLEQGAEALAEKGS